MNNQRFFLFIAGVLVGSCLGFVSGLFTGDNLATQRDRAQVFSNQITTCTYSTVSRANPSGIICQVDGAHRP